MNMMVDADTLLAIDVGTINTRANLFDVVDGRYRLVATGRAPSTGGAPLFDINEGVHMALDQVQAITGRRLVDESETLIMPVNNAGSGVDVFVATTSAGPKARVMLVGLMPGVSLQSARRLASSTYLDVVGELSLMDRLREEEHLDTILALKPDLILLAGGTDGGANESVIRMVETVGIATRILPREQSPRVLYCGNRELLPIVLERLGEHIKILHTTNIRPSLSDEDLAPARLRIAEVISEIRDARISGFHELEQWTGGYFMQTADGFGRIIRYLSQIYGPDKGVMGVDIGASHTTIAAGFDGEMRLAVNSDLGMGAAVTGVFKNSSVEEVSRWLPIALSEGDVRDYIYNKSLHPETIPADTDELHLEYALARQIIRLALTQARKGWPQGYDLESSWLLPSFEPIIASGGALARAPRPGYAALVLLDSLQPIGITTFVLDPHNLTPALGAASAPLPMAAVHVLESGSFASLGTIVSPYGKARPGQRVLRVQLEPESGANTISGEVRMGQLAVLPLSQGAHGRLTLRPERNIDVGFGGPGRAGALRVAGGAVGLIIDARGRPLRLPKDASQRRELQEKWLWDIGALE
ncbi:MAG: glutamate mutase L [Anaerolineales bacterium]|nr:glutamate mutase L [Anaerolineales bacterium]